MHVANPDKKHSIMGWKDSPENKSFAIQGWESLLDSPEPEWNLDLSLRWKDEPREFLETPVLTSLTHSTDKQESVSGRMDGKELSLKLFSDVNTNSTLPKQECPQQIHIHTSDMHAQIQT